MNTTYPPKPTDDVLDQAAYWKWFREEKGNPVGFHLTTHIMPLIERMAEEIATMRRQQFAEKNFPVGESFQKRQSHKNGS